MSQLRQAFRIEFRNPGRRSYPRWEQHERRFDLFAEAENFGMAVFSTSTEWRILSCKPKRSPR